MSVPEKIPAPVLDLALSNGLFRLIQAAVKVDEERDRTIQRLREEQSKTTQQLRNEALTDHLTQVGNRRLFDEYLEQRVAHVHRYPNRIGCLILTDIDHFKSVNDTYGHPAGDMVLAKFAKLLTERSDDRAFRYGGEEFAVVLEDTPLEGGLIYADRIRQRVKEASFGNDAVIIDHLTASFGVSPITEDLNVNSVTSLADQALYQAKREGRDMVVSAFILG